MTSNNQDSDKAALVKIRVWLAVFMTGLVLSGLTAFPLKTEVTFLSKLLHQFGFADSELFYGLVSWIDKVAEGLTATYSVYPFIAYGTDWLAFAHLVIATAFIGPWRDPVRNIWVIHWGMVACVGIIPLALIAGSIRGLPLGWELIDMSFGVFGIIPLVIIQRLTKRLPAYP